MLFGKFYRLSAKTSRFKEDGHPCICFWKPLMADSKEKQVNYLVILHYHERLSAKKERYEVWRGLTS